MSRSYRKNPICGWTCAESEKEDKRILNRKWRRRDNLSLRKDEEEFMPSKKNEVYNVWCMSKDGRQRFNPNRESKLMRK